jgi:hypothetical protein
MDWLLHVMGLCPDHASHPNAIVAAGVLAPAWLWCKTMWFKIRRRRE